jgi:hypothetical protein
MGMKMDFEAAVASYLTTDPHLFISAQYPLEWEGVEGGVFPDFLALHLTRKQAYIVEVTISSNWKALADKIKNTYCNHFKSIKEGLIKSGVIFQDWDLFIWTFVRKDNIPELQKSLGDLKGVFFTPIEDTAFPWVYWDSRWEGKAPGLPE